MEVVELFEKIKKEHRDFRERFESMIGSDPLSRRKQVVSLNAYINAHQQAEERTIYDAFKDMDGVPRSMALLRCEEHHITQILIKELADAKLDDDVWVAKMQVLRFLYAYHNNAEEEEMFEMAADYFTDDEIKAFLKKYEQVEAQLFEELKQSA